MKKQANKQHSIFDILGAFGRGPRNMFDEMTDDDLKSIHPYVLLRWLAGSNDPALIVWLNATANVSNNSQHRHKRLNLSIMQTVRGLGVRPKWIAPPARSKKSSRAITVIKESLLCSTRDAEAHLSVIDAQTVIEEAQRLGWQPDDIKKLTQELK